MHIKCLFEVSSDMIYYSGTRDIQLQHTAVALGKFDGLHRGHQLLFDKLAYYQEKGYQTVIFTFDFHPANILKHTRQNLIYSHDERLRLIRSLGVDVLIEFPFTEETAHMLPDTFVREVLLKALGAEVIVVGDDFHFGYKRSGDVRFLKEHQDEYGCMIDSCEKLCTDDGQEISATLIRSMIEAGDMERARDLLGRPYSVTGKVVKGYGNGRSVDMPTANLIPCDDKLLPPDGVYVSETILPETWQVLKSLTNIGCNPTIGDKLDRRIETFILQYRGDLYEKEISVNLYSRLRGEIKFESLEKLREQVRKDQEAAMTYFGEMGR